MQRHKKITAGERYFTICYFLIMVISFVTGIILATNDSV